VISDTEAIKNEIINMILFFTKSNSLTAILLLIRCMPGAGACKYGENTLLQNNWYHQPGGSFEKKPKELY